MIPFREEEACFPSHIPVDKFHIPIYQGLTGLLPSKGSPLYNALVLIHKRMESESVIYGIIIGVGD